MSSTQEKIKEIEEEMARTQKNKATSAHLGMLKAKLAKLKRELIAPSGGGGKTGEGFDAKKAGDARVGLVGFPSVGKSTLMSKLTGTESLAAAYHFTTLTCIPGTYKYKGCKIQLLDLPGIIEGAKDGKGRGRQVIGVARTCNIILIVLDASQPMTHKLLIEKELEGFGIRLNKERPNIRFTRRHKGGITYSTIGCKLTHLDKKTITAVCREYRCSNAEICFKQDATVDELIDVVEGNRVYTPCIYVLNMIDKITIEELDLLSQVPHYVPISGGHGWNFDLLREKIWEYLDYIRIYTKPRGQIPDYSSPVVIPRGNATVEKFCLRIHKHLLAQFKNALVWGTSAKHNPQRVGKDHVLADEDVVQIIKRIK
mmetsp:Transcript_18468/g.45333  ORF Transcript_18468/g.45333 Transcript_18468/m.45333 type:complete len:370 (-) Transcript_18468:203-1312(-)|eukprot:CAMPEP_0114508676 /NCGR_PEP_ID=MMETSP0109-20121206/12753_1 /TAXON_ID=29199 /ORGANISM="Chlorarachnion reptans, Strain CCCM449" /LENGTH=369 /DNA_ID=CAMNT_0001687677 /DNA_START=108 /DNA_END=1217 /DNA_ORIENTATION=+